MTAPQPIVVYPERPEPSDEPGATITLEVFGATLDEMVTEADRQLTTLGGTGWTITFALHVVPVTVDGDDTVTRWGATVYASAWATS